jgi:hypothetical protein
VPWLGESVSRERERVRRQHAVVDQMARDFAEGKRKAVDDYFSGVLTVQRYPSDFPAGVRMAKSRAPAVRAEITAVGHIRGIPVILGRRQPLELPLAGRALPTEKPVRVDRDRHTQSHFTISHKLLPRLVGKAPASLASARTAASSIPGHNSASQIKHGAYMAVHAVTRLQDEGRDDARDDPRL